jgi:hypothetical protein
MATLNECIYGILNRVRPKLSDDESLTERQVQFDFENARARFLRNEFNKNRTIDPAFIQDLGCIPLEVVDRAECCEISADCYIVRTALELPGTIEKHNETSHTRVGPIDKMQKPYSLVPYERAVYAGNGRFNNNAIFAFLRNKRIYLVSNNRLIKHMEYLNVQGVFEEPRKAADFVTCDNKPCYTDNSQYPINKWLIDHITRMLIQEYLPSSQLPIDMENDASPVVTEQQAQS